LESPESGRIGFEHKEREGTQRPESGLCLCVLCGKQIESSEDLVAENAESAEEREFSLRKPSGFFATLVLNDSVGSELNTKNAEECKGVLA